MTHPGDLLSAYLDGEVTRSERVSIDEHLSRCFTCRCELEGLASARSAVRGLPVLDLPPFVIGVPRPAGVHRTGRVVAWAASAAAAAAIAVGALAGGGSAAPAFDLDALVDRHTARVVVDPGIATVRGPAGGP